MGEWVSDEFDIGKHDNLPVDEHAANEFFFREREDPDMRGASIKVEDNKITIVNGFDGKPWWTGSTIYVIVAATLEKVRIVYANETTHVMDDCDFGFFDDRYKLFINFLRSLVDEHKLQQSTLDDDAIKTFSAEKYMWLGWSFTAPAALAAPAAPPLTTQPRLRHNNSLRNRVSYCLHV